MAQRWTSGEDKALRLLVAANMAVEDIVTDGRIIRRTPAAIRKRVTVLGLEWPERNGSMWSDAELDVVREAIKDGMTEGSALETFVLPKLPNRTLAALRTKVQEHRVGSKINGAPACAPHIIENVTQVNIAPGCMIKVKLRQVESGLGMGLHVDISPA